MAAPTMESLGWRADYSPNYYAAFLLQDPDGYRIEAYCARTPLAPTCPRKAGESVVRGIRAG